MNQEIEELRKANMALQHSQKSLQAAKEVSVCCALYLESVLKIPRQNVLIRFIIVLLLSLLIIKEIIY